MSVRYYTRRHCTLYDVLRDLRAKGDVIIQEHRSKGEATRGLIMMVEEFIHAYGLYSQA